MGFNSAFKGLTESVQGTLDPGLQSLTGDRLLHPIFLFVLIPHSI